jgi:hypothetical protein
MPEEMEIEKPKKKPGTNPLTWLALLFLLIALYVFSTGPVDKLVVTGHLPERCSNIYIPLTIAAEHFPVLNKFYEWYIIKMWNAVPPRKPSA